MCAKQTRSNHVPLRCRTSLVPPHPPHIRELAHSQCEIYVLISVHITTYLAICMFHTSLLLHSPCTLEAPMDSGDATYTHVLMIPRACNILTSSLFQCLSVEFEQNLCFWRCWSCRSKFTHNPHEFKQDGIQPFTPDELNSSSLRMKVEYSPVSG